jgi:hypothetical protein
LYEDDEPQPQPAAVARPSQWLDNAAFGAVPPPLLLARHEDDEDEEEGGAGQRRRSSKRRSGGEQDDYDDDDDYDYDEYEEDDDEDEDEDEGRRRNNKRGSHRKSTRGGGDDGNHDDDEDDDEEAQRDSTRLSQGMLASSSYLSAAPLAYPTAAAADDDDPHPPAPPPALPPPRPSFVPVRRSVAEALLVPSGRTRYWPVFTITATVMFVGVFAFMAGGYGGYLAQEQQRRAAAEATAAAAAATDPNAAAALSPPLPPLLPDPPQPAWWSTPRNMGHWLAFWRPTPQTTFAWPYLAAWGGRYAPALLKKQGGWRIVASLGLHASAAHLASNLLVFLLLSAHLEYSYGPLRVGAAFFGSCIAGTFLSLAFEDPCALYVGASGGASGRA